jgi:dUTP pyrophosphatase
MKDLVIYVKQLESAKGLPLPSYQSDLAAGADLYAAQTHTIEPGAYVLVETGIAVEIPKGYEAQVRARSGLAAKHGIGLVNGVGTIDADYRGEIKVIMINWGTKAYTINRGERIAQMVIQPILKANFKLTNLLSDTERGEGGFGHTGNK